MVEVDPAFFDAHRCHVSGFADAMNFGSSQVGKLDTLLIDSGEVVVEVEEIAGHEGQSGSREHALPLLAKPGNFLHLD